MNCPVCPNGTLASTPVEGYPVKVDHCAVCKGIWLDRGELERLLDVPVEALEIPRAAPISRRSCPQCMKSMRSFNYPDTFASIDMCKHCMGIWLDAGEFQEIDSVRAHLLRDPGGGETQRLQADGDRRRRAPTGVKSGMLNFVDGAISFLWSWVRYDD